MAEAPEDELSAIDDPLLGNARVSPFAAPKVRLYARRWWLVFILSLIGVEQSATWNFYSPISTVVEPIFGWSGGLVELFANVAGITFTVTVSFCSMLIDTRGVRLSVSLAALCTFGCAALRVVPTSMAAHKYTVLASMIPNGVSGAIIALAPPLLSAAWFPVNERTTATAVAVTFNYMGQAVGFLVGPALVHAGHNDSVVNATAWTHKLPSHMSRTMTAVPTAADSSLAGLHRLYWIHGGITLGVLVMTLIYFPSKPPTPPTESASIEKTEFLVGFKQLLVLRPFWVVVVCFGVPLGWFGGWLAVLDLNLQELGISTDNASRIGALQIAAGCVAGIAAGKASDVVGGRYKHFLCSMYMAAGMALFWFLAISNQWVSYSLVSVYISTTLVGALLNGTIPLFMELAMETVFPIAEGSAAGFLVLVQNLLQSVFLVLPVDSWGTKWMNWSLAIMVPFFAIAMFFTLPEARNRSCIDLQAK